MILDSGLLFSATLYTPLHGMKTGLKIILHR